MSVGLILKQIRKLKNISQKDIAEILYVSVSSIYRFENGGKVAVPLKKIGNTNKTGTTVRFLPDPEIFSTINFSYTTICERMQESAFLLKG